MSVIDVTTGAGSSIKAGQGSLAKPTAISLEALNDLAALQTRRDRKYIVAQPELDRLLAALAPQHRVLEIGGRRRFRYETVYFDTPNIDLYEAAATGRRRRYKVRTRTYLDSGECMLEVKTKGPRGQTSKHRIRYGLDDRTTLTTGAQDFIEGLVGEASAGSLARVLTTTYERSTWVDPIHATRLTIDAKLLCFDRLGRQVGLDALIVETKSASAPSAADRWLWAHGIRPAKISKYCTGLAALHPELRSNKWHRTLQHNWSVT